MVTIRNETEADYPRVEDLTRRAFYNLYVPGCHEHYLVHIMRDHRDFLPELSFVLELDGEIAGSILYTRASLEGKNGQRKDILTFGPLCVAPERQRQGYGKALIEHSFAKAGALGWEAVVIFGAPANYVGRGFQCCKRYQVQMEDGSCPTAMLVKELRPGALDGGPWVYRDSPVMQIDEEAARRYDDRLPPMERRVLPCQEEFYILSRSVLR
ncbi:MAG: N-acetyltransferase [Oscillibacter sp.]|nr:N-acetyltransferase [Oscillibacter sp.]